jgi:hypothetical protein
MNVTDFRLAPGLKIISLIILCILGLIIIRDVFAWWQIPMQLQSPVIPQSFVREQANQFLYAALVAFGVFIPGFICWRLHKYKAALFICLVGLLAYFIYFNYFRY